MIREFTWNQFVAMYGPRPDVLSDVMAEIFLMNRLSDEEKKRLLSQRASARSSPWSWAFLEQTFKPWCSGGTATRWSP